MIHRRSAIGRVAAVLVAGAVMLSGCGVIEDTVDGFTGSPIPTGTPDLEAADEIVIEVRFDSDGGTARSVEVDIDSPSSPQSLREDAVDLPFSKEFTIEANEFLPFRGVTAQAEAGEGATFISCEIVMDGEVVASHHGSGSDARAECERQLRLGPS
jgi:hypothetical protein